MGNRDRPRHQPKRKPKDKSHKAPPPPSVYEPPTTVEVVKPRRKPRHEPGENP
jgi:hypothetical protein